MFKKFGLMLLALFLTGNIFADPNAAKSLANILGTYKSYKAKFIQTSYDNNGAKLSKTNGNMALLRPGFFRWETDKPTKQIIITDSKNVWVYDIDLEQVTIEPMKKMLGEAPASLLTDTTDDLIKDFYITENLTTRAGRWFTLTPKDKSSLYQQIKLYFLQAKLDKMVLTDNIGQKITVQFVQAQINPTLSKNTFKEKIPKGVDVIGKPV